MGIVDWLKTWEGGVTIGVVGWEIIGGWLKQKTSQYVEKVGENIGRKIAEGARNPTSEYTVSDLYKKLEHMESRIANLEEKYKAG